MGKPPKKVADVEPYAWEDQPWASREAKRKEKPIKNDEPWKLQLKSERRSYYANPDQYVDEVQEEETDYKAIIRDGIRDKQIVVAARSGDADLVRMQKTINTMARKFKLLKKTPKLIIHNKFSDDEVGRLKQLNAFVMVPEYIETNEFTKNHFLKFPKHFGVVAAHEMGHIYMDDCGPENTVKFNLMPPNQLKEVLADRMGAIIYGNPMEYARLTAEFQFHDCKLGNTRPYRYTMERLSANGNARMLHKWAKILGDAGALKPNGDVILDKALAVFEQSRSISEGLLEESLKWGLAQPRPHPGR